MHRYKLAAIIFWILALLCLLLLLWNTSGPAYGFTPLESFDNRDWAYFSLLTIDWAQTRDIAARPWKFEECNPVLGSHPSIGEVDRYFKTTGLVSLGIHYAGLHSDFWGKVEDYQQTTGIVIEVYCVGRNYGLGINLRFP